MNDAYPTADCASGGRKPSCRVVSVARLAFFFRLVGFVSIFAAFSFAFARGDVAS